MESLILFNIFVELGTAHNSIDIHEWAEKHTYGQMSDQIMNKLAEMGYQIVFAPPLQGRESALTTDEGE